MKDGQFGEAGPSLRPTPIAGLRSALILFIMLVAFLGQSIAVGSHVHALGAASEAGIAAWTHSDAKQGVSKQAPVDGAADCPLCAELATSGHYLPPDPVILPEAPLPLLWLFILPAVAAPRRSRSHRWQSRAPPQ